MSHDAVDYLLLQGATPSRTNASGDRMSMVSAGPGRFGG